MEEFVEKMLVAPLLCGVCFVAVAAIMYFFPPMKVNMFYGYRTRSSMSSQDRWDFSQRYSAIQMFRGAIMLILISFTGYFLKFPDKTTNYIGAALVLIVTGFVIWSTEKAIKQKFPQQ